MPDADDPGDRDEESRRLDPRAIRVHEVGLGIFLGLLIGVNLLGAVIAAIAERRRLPVLAVVSAAETAAAGVLFWLGRRWAHASWRHTSYVVSTRGLEIRRGVWWRHVVSVPRSRIQHADVSQGPLQRAYGLATLVLYTAGAQYAKIELDGLAHEAALALREDLLRTDRGAPVTAPITNESPAPEAAAAPTPHAPSRPHEPRDDDDALE